MKPFLKWPGGKYRLVDRIASQLDSDARRLVEPFVGSGAIFLNTDYRSYLLGDSNEHLINLYKTVQCHKRAFIKDVREFFRPETNTQETYLNLRELFNNSQDSYEKALLFLYLNRHGYNGLCRFNSKGGFNVPFGRNAKPYFPETELEFFIVKSQKAEFVHGDFRLLMEQVQRGDTVYADPPYVPLSETASFTAYDGVTFGPADQQTLINLARYKASEGITTVISNHNTEEIIQDYKRAGARVSEFEVRRFISCQGERRGYAPELLAVFS